MDTMRKPWVYKRKHIKGWWCGWYEGGKRKAKALPSKALAEHFRHIKYTQLNSDVFTSVVHFDRHTISTRNRKAGKAMPERPVPEETMTELSNHVATLPDGQEQLFADKFNTKKWDRIREQVKFPGLIFQVLRRTFASLLAQRGVSTAVTQRLLEHSSPQLTNDVCANVDPVLRQAVGLLSVASRV